MVFSLVSVKYNNFETLDMGFFLVLFNMQCVIFGFVVCSVIFAIVASRVLCIMLTIKHLFCCRAHFFTKILYASSLLIVKFEDMGLLFTLS